MDHFMTTADLAIGDFVSLREEDVAQTPIPTQVRFVEGELVQRPVGAGNVVVESDLQIEANGFSWRCQEYLRGRVWFVSPQMFSECTRLRQHVPEHVRVAERDLCSGASAAAEPPD